MTRSRLAIHTLIFILLAALVPAGLSHRKADAAAQDYQQSNRLIVHEWGTFTCVAGKDGVAIEWHPLNGPSDLPEFVYDFNDLRNENGFRHGYNCFKCAPAVIRMETPVLYFYSDSETDVSVSVAFTKGKITEWYPQARAVWSQSVDWGRFTVTPGSDAAFPAESKQSHYYAARETDAAPIRVCGEGGEQYEKFLFYRGIGNFDLPLAVTLRENRLIVKNISADDVAPIILFENRGGRIGYRVYHSFKRRMERPTLDGSIEELEREIEMMLVARGLYQKEARAMVNTWRDSWFEEGLRVFYIVPRSVADQILPLRIEPQPAEIVRVLVGRTEIISPETEQSIEQELSTLRSSSIDDVAMKIKREHGRFAEPVLKMILEKTTDAKARTRIERLIKSS